MKRAAVVLLSAALLIPGGALAGGHEDFLTVTDGVIVDGLGREVLLRGLNHIGLRSDRTHLDNGPDDQFELQDLQDDDFDAMTAMGFNSVRLVVTWEFAEPSRGSYDAAYFALIDDAIDKARARGMSVVFDFGQFGWSRSLGGNAGAPDWTVSDTCRSMPGPQPGAPPQASASVGCAYYNFWTNSNGIQDAYIDLWRFVAARYAAEPGISMYDLQNEPVSGPIPPGVFEYEYLYPFYRRLAEAIREVDGVHPIAFQPQIYRSIGVPMPFVEPIGIDNAIYMPHSYTATYLPQRVDPSWASPFATALDADMGALQVEADGFGTPWLLGETGWTRSTHADGVGGPREEVDPDAPPGFARALTIRADQRRVGWHWFAYSSIDEAYGINHGDTLDEPLVEELARVFPRAVGGRIGHFAEFVAGSGWWELIVDGATSAPTELSVPMRWRCPGGFEAIVAPNEADPFEVEVDGDGAVTAAPAGVTYSIATSVLTIDVGPVGYLLVIC